MTSDDAVKYGMLTHTDLDAAGAAIMIRNLYPIKAEFRCGYGKIDTTLQDAAGEGVNVLVVADISFTPEQLDEALSLFEKVIYYDHHLQSNQHLEHEEAWNRFFPYVDMTRSSTKIAADELIRNIEKHLDNKILPFVRLSTWIDAYDLWKHETDPGHFKSGYDLNTLFSIVGFDKFVIMFNDGFDYERYKPYAKKVEARKAEIVASIEKAEIIPSGPDALIFVEDQDTINDFTIFKPDFRVYFMVYKSSHDGMRLSIRVRGSDINMVEYLNLLPTCNEWGSIEHLVLSKGGHAKACGMNFAAETMLEDVVSVVDMLHNMIMEDERLAVV